MTGAVGSIDLFTSEGPPFVPGGGLAAAISATARDDQTSTYPLTLRTKWDFQNHANRLSGVVDLEEVPQKDPVDKADGGGWSPIQRFIDAGIIDAFSIGKLDVLKHSPLGLLRKLSRGDWPRGNGDGTAKILPSSPEEVAQVGAYAVEGLTSIAELLMEELRVRQQRIGEDAVGSFTVDGEKFSANNRAHYNFVHNEVAGLVKGFSSQPVEHVQFTALEGRGEDEATRESIRAPATVGKAATAKVPAWVGDVLHADSYSVEVKVPDPASKFNAVQLQIKVRMWFVRHPDANFPTISYPAKLRVPPEQMEKVLKRWPGGYFEPTTTGGLDWLLELEDQLAAESARELEQLMAQVREPDCKAA